MVAQQTLIGRTDNPGQFREPPRSGIFWQAWRGALRAQRRDERIF